MGSQTTKQKVSQYIFQAIFNHQVMKNSTMVKCSDVQTGVLQRHLRASESKRPKEKKESEVRSSKPDIDQFRFYV